MVSPEGQRAIEDAIKCGKAILRFITPNNVGLTGSHECGYYLPKPLWRMYTQYPPTKGTNSEAPVSITWPDGRVTDSCVKWYGRGTRSEYRLTRFGRDFPWLSPDSVGQLLVLVPHTLAEFTAHVLDLEEDIAEIQAALNVDLDGEWAVYNAGAEEPEDEDECLNAFFRNYASSLDGFPSGDEFSSQARLALNNCCGSLRSIPADDLLMRYIDAEFALFKRVERLLCQPDIVRVFKSVDDFISTAATIMNRRKSRAGRSLENHFSFILQQARIPHDMRPEVDGRPDVLIPGRAQYLDDGYPVDRLFAVGLKRTCKDRWRQVLNEARKTQSKYILTLQPGISARQLGEMVDSSVSLVVPQSLHAHYPRSSPMRLLTISEFITKIQQTLG